MKRIIKLLSLVIFCIQITNCNWSTVSKEQAEYESIQKQIQCIANEVSRYGNSLSSPDYQYAVFKRLKTIGTPVAYKILLEMIERHELPDYYLQIA